MLLSVASVVLGCIVPLQMISQVSSESSKAEIPQGCHRENWWASCCPQVDVKSWS